MRFDELDVIDETDAELTANQQADLEAHQAVLARFGGKMPEGDKLAIQTPIDPLEELARRAAPPVPRLDDEDPPRNDEPELLEAWTMGHRAGMHGDPGDTALTGALLREFRTAFRLGARRRAAIVNLEHAPATSAAPKRMSAPPRKGKVASQVQDSQLVKAIAKACAEGMSYKQAEAKFGLRQANGMTAWRICQRHRKG